MAAVIAGGIFAVPGTDKTERYRLHCALLLPIFIVAFVIALVFNGPTYRQHCTFDHAVMHFGDYGGHLFCRAG